MLKLSDVTTACRDLNQLSAQAQKACALFLEECKRQGLNVLVTETYRSQERQNYLYEQGRSRAGDKVTWTKSSRHTSRRAWDICKNVKGQEYSDKSFFKKCAEIAALFGITWGGDWNNTPDTPHFEVDLAWKLPTVSSPTDNDLFNAVSSIIKGGAELTFNAWKRLDLINLNNVPALVCKLVGIEIDGSVSDIQYKQAIDKLVLLGAISQRLIWDEKRYTVNNVRSLLIKFSKLG